MTHLRHLRFFGDCAEKEETYRKISMRGVQSPLVLTYHESNFSNSIRSGMSTWCQNKRSTGQRLDKEKKETSISTTSYRTSSPFFGLTKFTSDSLFPRPLKLSYGSVKNTEHRLCHQTKHTSKTNLHKFDLFTLQIYLSSEELKQDNVGDAYYWANTMGQEDPS